MSRLKHSRKSQVLAAAFAMDGARKIPKDESEANEQFLQRIVQYTEEEAQRRFLQTITHHTAVSRAEAKGVDCCLVPYFLFVCQSISYYGCSSLQECFFGMLWLLFSLLLLLLLWMIASEVDHIHTVWTLSLFMMLC